MNRNSGGQCHPQLVHALRKRISFSIMCAFNNVSTQYSILRVSGPRVDTAGLYVSLSGAARTFEQ